MATNANAPFNYETLMATHLKDIILDGTYPGKLIDVQPAPEKPDMLRFTFEVQTSKDEKVTKYVDRQISDKDVQVRQTGEIVTVNEVKSFVVKIANAVQSQTEHIGKALLITIRGGFIQELSSKKSATKGGSPF